MFPAPLIGIVVALLVIGVVLWVLSQLPIDATIQKFIRIIIIAVVAIWIIYLLAGMFGGAGLGYGYPAVRH